MIEAYRTDNTDYIKNGDMPLLPINAKVNVELNGTWALELEHPIDDEGRWKYLEEEAVVKCPSFNGDQLFRIKSIEKNDDSVLVKAYPIFFDSKNDCFLADVRPTGKNGQDALNIMLAPNKKYSAQSDIAKSTTAYYEYMNLMEAINGDNANSFLNRWGGEILYDNFKIIVNERVGGDYGVELRYGKNIPANGITETVDMSEVVTRIYPKSYNGYKLSGNGYVDSPILSNYPTVKAATMKFDNIKMREDAQEDDEEKGIVVCDTKAELDKALTEACKKQFEAGLDKPKVTIEADMVLLQNTDQYKDYEILETVSLGDTIHCRHDKLGIISDARVVGLEYDCILNRVTSVVLGQFQSNYIDHVTSSVDKIDSVIDSDGDIMAERVKGILDGITTQLRLQSTVAKKVNGRAFIAEDLDPNSPLYGCIAWGTQGIEIANKRTADGRDWDWSTAMTANGIVANAIISGLLADRTGRNFWDLDNGEFSLSSSAFRVDGKVIKEYMKSNWTQDEIFNKLTNDGKNKGIYMKDGQLYVNASYILSGILKLGGINNEKGELQIVDENGKVVGKWDKDGILIESGEVNAGTIKGGTFLIGGRDNPTGKLVVQDPYGNVTAKIDRTGFNILQGEIYSQSYTSSSSIHGGRIHLTYGLKNNPNPAEKEKNIGYIGTNKIKGKEKYGIVFDLENEGDYMSWASRNNPSDDTYEMKLSYFREKENPVDFNVLQAGCDLDLGYHKLKRFNWDVEGGAVTGKIEFKQVLEMDLEGKVTRYANASMEFVNGILVNMSCSEY